MELSRVSEPNTEIIRVVFNYGFRRHIKRHLPICICEILWAEGEIYPVTEFLLLPSPAPYMSIFHGLLPGNTAPKGKISHNSMQAGKSTKDGGRWRGFSGVSIGDYSRVAVLPNPDISHAHEVKTSEEASCDRRLDSVGWLCDRVWKSSVELHQGSSWQARKDLHVLRRGTANDIPHRPKRLPLILQLAPGGFPAGRSGASAEHSFYQQAEFLQVSSADSRPGQGKVSAVQPTQARSEDWKKPGGDLCPW